MRDQYPPPDQPKQKALPWHRARKLKAATASIHVSLDGDRDRVSCKRCDESIELLEFDQEGNDRNAQVNAFARRHYERHPIMVDV